MKTLIKFLIILLSAATYLNAIAAQDDLMLDQIRKSQKMKISAAMAKAANEKVN